MISFISIPPLNWYLDLKGEPKSNAWTETRLALPFSTSISSHSGLIPYSTTRFDHFYPTQTSPLPTPTLRLLRSTVNIPPTRMHLPLHPSPSLPSQLTSTTTTTTTSPPPPLAWLDAEPFLIELQGSLELEGRAGVELNEGEREGIRVGWVDLAKVGFLFFSAGVVRSSLERGCV